ncbi:hypothetical protein, partial [Bacillus altitudinis]|uniref:hypothetical protein n=1 Tax=Bacillus altitudinis TaxID=293387 RepID=UPI001C92D510
HFTPNHLPQLHPLPNIHSSEYPATLTLNLTQLTKITSPHPNIFDKPFNKKHYTNLKHPLPTTATLLPFLFVTSTPPRLLPALSGLI